MSAPLLVGILGLVMVAFSVYLFAVGKRRIVKWVAVHIFRNQRVSEKSAEGLLNVLASFLHTIGGLWIILAVFFFSRTSVRF